MENDRASTSVRNKKKRIQYVNDFRTGQTKVLEKTEKKFSRSVNSSFEILPGPKLASDDRKLENTRVDLQATSLLFHGNQDPQVKIQDNNSTNIDSSRNKLKNIDPVLTNVRTVYLQGNTKVSTYNESEHTCVSQLEGEREWDEPNTEDSKEAMLKRISVTNHRNDRQATDGHFFGKEKIVSNVGDNKPEIPFVYSETNGISGTKTNIYSDKIDAYNDKSNVYNHTPDVCSNTGHTLLSDSSNKPVLQRNHVQIDFSGQNLEFDHFKKEIGDSSKKRVNLNEESRLIDGSFNNISIDLSNSQSDNMETLTNDNETYGVDYSRKSDRENAVCIETIDKIDNHESTNIIETGQEEHKELIFEKQNKHVSDRNTMLPPIFQSCIELIDKSTQTDFVYTSFQEVYSILCEKCGHKIDMQEILLNLMNYPLLLNHGHICTDLEEKVLINANIDSMATDREDRTDHYDTSFSVETCEKACIETRDPLSKETRDHHPDRMTLDPKPFANTSVLPIGLTLTEDSSKAYNALGHIPEEQDIFSGQIHNEQETTLGQIPNEQNTSFGPIPNEQDTTLGRIANEQDTTLGRIPNEQDTILGQIPNEQDTTFDHIPDEQKHNAKTESSGQDNHNSTTPEQNELNDELSTHVTTSQIGDHRIADIYQQEQQTADGFNQALEGFQDTYQSFAYQDDKRYNPLSHQPTPKSIDEAGNAVIDRTLELIAAIHDNKDKDNERVLPPRKMEEQGTEPVINGSTGTNAVFNPLYIANRTYPKRQNVKKLSSSPIKQCNKHSYKHRRGKMKDLSDFAEDNSLDLHNVNADGNCMFSAVVDQLWINGNFYFTPGSLRKKAVEFLRKVPTHKDGTHLDSFLITESWEDYLCRMEKDGVWGDHMVLQGVSEVTRCRIIVINSDMVKTELVPWHAACNDAKLDVVILGHMGEYHYVSLRPSNWQITWAIRAKIRLLNEIKTTDSSEESAIVNDTNNSSNASCSNSKSQSTEEGGKTDDHTITNEEENAQSENNGTGSSENNGQVSTDDLDLSYLAIENADLIDRSQDATATVELLDSQGDLNKILADTEYIDLLSGVPLCHLSFYVRQLLEPDDIYRSFFLSNFNYYGRPSARQINVDTIIYGSVGEELDIRVQRCPHQSFICPKILVYKADVADIVYDVESVKNPHALIVDMETCRPGFLRLQILDRQYFEKCDVVSIENKTFLEKLSFIFNYDDRSEWVNTCVTQGIECCKWPSLLTSDWFIRERASGWPDSNVLEELSTRPCHIRKYENQSNECPDILWQFVFPLVETDLMVHYMDGGMKYVMRIFKLLIETHTSSSPKRLKTNHLKTVMLFCCESISKSVWSDNIGGAIIYLVSTLMEYLHQRHLPHYIMDSVNLLDGYTQNEVDTLLSDVERIRLFPLMAVNVFAESNYLENQWIIQSVVDDMHRYRQDRDYLKSIEQSFCPTLLELAKRLTMKGICFFQKAYTILQGAYERIRYVEEERLVENRQAFEKFVEPFVYSIDDPIERYFFTNFVDKKLETSVLEKMTISDHVRLVGDIVEKENNGRFNEFPVPDGSKIDDVEYLDKFSRYLMEEGENETAAHFLRRGVALGKDGIKSDTIDISGITEKEVKQQIADKNMKTVDNFSDILLDLYDNLIECYSHMKQPMLFQEFIHDYEELVITFDYPCYYSRLASVWRKLGNEEKAQMFGRKSEQFRKNVHTTQV